MPDDVPLARNERAFIVLLAVAQGGLMYLAQKGQELGWPPFDALGGRVCWFTLVLAIPTMMALSVVRLRDPRFWQHAVGATVVFLALAAWAAHGATGDPGIAADSVLAPFGVSAGIGLFVALPWLQCRLADGRWRASHACLSGHAWQNALTLALAALFTGLCWMVLWLWGALFALVDVVFFRDLFREDAFAWLATGAMAGLGVLVGRTRQRPVQVARQVLSAISTGLLPLVAAIALMFVAALPFTGLAPLWDMRSATVTLLAVVALLVGFASTALPDDGGGAPYPAWLRRVVAAGLAVAPLYAALALYALWLRIDQHGWTPDRVRAVLLALVAGGYAVGYAWAALRRGGRPGALRGVNTFMSLVVVGVAVLGNTPLLDAQRIAVADQMARLENGRTAPDTFDIDWLRHHAGRAGYEATLSLRTHPAWAGDADRLAELERVIARTSRWDMPSDGTPPSRNVADLRRAVQLADGATVPGTLWWDTLASGGFGRHLCARASDDCILLTRDLDADGEGDPLLCSLGAVHGVQCTLTVRARDGSWSTAATLHLWPEDATPERQWRRALREDLVAGRLEAVPRRWPDLRIGDRRPRALEPADGARRPVP